MADAARHCDNPRDLALTEIALARDLADAGCANLAAMLDQARRDAVAYLDALECDANTFAARLRRLATLCAGVARRLGCPPEQGSPESAAA
jgi:hypothetical protein